MNTTPPATVAKPPKIAMVSILIDQQEGLIEDCKKTTHTSWTAANAHLLGICRKAPKDGTYHKCAFIVAFADGETYEGRFDAAHPHSSAHEVANLEQHITEHLLHLAGLKCPDHMSQEEYDRITAERDPKTKAEAVAFLSKYSLRDRPAGTSMDDEAANKPEAGKFYRKGDTAARIAMAITGLSAIVKDLENGAEQLRKQGNTLDASLVLGQAVNARKALAAMIAARLEE